MFNLMKPLLAIRLVFMSINAKGKCLKGKYFINVI